MLNRLLNCARARGVGQVAVMEMAQGFLQPVLNPSVMFLEGRDPTLDVCASVTVIMEGSIPMLLEVQVRDDAMLNISGTVIVC